MKLTYNQRTSGKKCDSKKLRRAGHIPAVLYSRGQHSESITIDGTAFKGMLRKVIPGRLSTVQFELDSENGGTKRAILKEIQYEPTTYDIIHLDFEELHDDCKVNVKVPIEYVGGAECPGVKLGNVLRPVLRNIKVRCLPKDIPEVFQLDVRTMGARESRRLKDIAIPDHIRPLANLNEVAVVTAKR